MSCGSFCCSPDCWQCCLCPGGSDLGLPPEGVNGILLLWDGGCLPCWLQAGGFAATVLSSHTARVVQLWAMRMGSATLKSALEAGIRTAAHLRPGRLSSPRLSTRATGWLGQRFNPAAPVTAAGEADRVSTLVALQAESGWLAKVTGAWQAAKISNLDYLLYCNLAAGRSFNDLTQVSGSAAEAPSTTFNSLELSAATVSPLTVAGAPRHF